MYILSKKWRVLALVACIVLMTILPSVGNRGVSAPAWAASLSSTSTPILSVSPAQLNCTSPCTGKVSPQVTVTGSNIPQAGGLSWKASWQNNSKVVATVKPPSGTLSTTSPPMPVIIAITVNACPASIVFQFMGPKNTQTVSWSCQGGAPTATATFTPTSTPTEIPTPTPTSPSTETPTPNSPTPNPTATATSVKATATTPPSQSTPVPSPTATPSPSANLAVGEQGGNNTPPDGSTSSDMLATSIGLFLALVALLLYALPQGQLPLKWRLLSVVLPAFLLRWLRARG